MPMIVETYEHADVTVQIHYDDEGPQEFYDPRQHDNLGTMYCWHPHYDLGDEHFMREDYESMEDVAVELIHSRGAIVVLPLFLLDHSGLRIRAGSNVAPQLVPERAELAANGRFLGDDAGWDTTMVGFIYTTDDKARELLGEDWRATCLSFANDPETWLCDRLLEEIDEYDKFLSGECFGYVVGEGTPFADSCWGFLGDEYVRETANEVAELVASKIADEARERADWAARGVVTSG